MRKLRATALTMACVLPCMSYTAIADTEVNPDPWEGFNRSVYTFNDALDRAILKPAAQGYRYVMPDIAEQGVSNFFDNLGDIKNLANNLLQGKFDRSLNDFARLTFNTTIGLAGFIDVATPMGLEPSEEDFGQTLATWGVPSGPYLVLPFFGPSTVRDGVSMPADMALNPVNQVDDIRTRNSLYALNLLDTRAGLLDKEQIVMGDKYLFLRDSYLQRREFLINDGQVEAEFNADDF